MRTLSLPLEEYKADLIKAEQKGRTESMRRFFLILKEAKNDPREAVTMIVEEFEDDQRSIDAMLINLDLMKTAEKMWSNNA